MATLETVSDYVSDARTLLQDTITPYRYSDLELVVGLNITIDDTRRLRPDLFLGDGTTTNFGSIPSFAAADSTVVEIENGFRYAVLLGMLGHTILRDQEDVQDARAAIFMRLWRDKLVGPIGTEGNAP